jgi:acyl-homoserine lactone synthase
MLHVVTPENRHLYTSEIRDQHKIRHDVYVEERRWVGLQSRDGLEFDQFDTDDTVYFLAIERGRVVGGSRMNPTLKPHLLATICPELAEIKGIPRSPDIYEWTRMYAVKDRRDGGRFGSGVIGEIFSGCLEYAYDEAISALSLQFEAWWLPRLQQHGWEIKPLGLPTLINGEWWLGALIPITAEMVRSTRAFYRISDPVLVRNGITKPLIRAAA